MKYWPLIETFLLVALALYWFLQIVKAIENIQYIRNAMEGDLRGLLEEGALLQKKLDYALKLGVRHPRPSQDNGYRAHVRNEAELRELMFFKQGTQEEEVDDVEFRRDRRSDEVSPAQSGGDLAASGAE